LKSPGRDFISLLHRICAFIHCAGFVRDRLGLDCGRRLRQEAAIAVDELAIVVLVLGAYVGSRVAILLSRVVVSV